MTVEAGAAQVPNRKTRDRPVFGLVADHRVALAILAVCGTALLLYSGRGTGFYFDEWSFISDRRGWGADAFLQPHNEHFSLVPVAIYKLLFVTAGLDHYLVYRLVVIAVHLACCVLVYRLVVPRLGTWAAVAAAAAVLFLGSAWQDLLWPFQIGYLLSVAAGLAAWVALDRGDGRGDVIAAICLMISLASSSLGIPIAIGIAAELLAAAGIRHRRWWIVGVPLAVYVLWYLGYGRGALQSENAAVAPGWALDAAAAAFGSFTGHGRDWGRTLLVGAVAIGVWSLVRDTSRLSPRLVGVTVTAVAFWVLTALARADEAAPDESRYLYLGAVAIVLAVAEIARGRLPAKAALIAAGLLVLASAALNVQSFRDGGRGLRATSEAVRAELAAVEAEAPNVPPAFQPDPQRAPQIVARTYLAAVKDLDSSPALPESELIKARNDLRQAADATLLATGAASFAADAGRTAAGTGAAPTPVAPAGGGQARTEGPCVVVEATTPLATADLEVHSQRIDVVSQRGSAEVRVRRWADGYPQNALGGVPEHGAASVTLRPDHATVPWKLQLTSTGRAKVCSAA